MFRFVRNFIFVLVLAALAAGGIAICTSDDPLYVTQQLLALGRYHRYDGLILNVGKKYGVDPKLIKALIWRESSFRPDKKGKNGERGLMQVTVGAATDWARQTKHAPVSPDDLYKPEINIEVGTWYLKNALQRYAGKDDPMTFALAEYNAGKSRVDKWVVETNQGSGATAGDLRDSISFPSTREYVDTILDRYHYYQKHHHL